MSKKVVGEDGRTYKVKKPFYKRVWFWVLAVIVIFIVGGSLGGKDNSNATNNAGKTTSASDSQNTKVYSTQDLKVTVSKAIVHNTDWLIKGKTKAPNNSKIAAVIIDN